MLTLPHLEHCVQDKSKQTTWSATSHLLPHLTPIHSFLSFSGPHHTLNICSKRYFNEVLFSWRTMKLICQSAINTCTALTDKKNFVSQLFPNHRDMYVNLLQFFVQKRPLWWGPKGVNPSFDFLSLAISWVNGNMTVLRLNLFLAPGEFILTLIFSSFCQVGT